VDERASGRAIPGAVATVMEPARTAGGEPAALPVESGGPDISQ
jgi:hypothetical protein